MADTIFEMSEWIAAPPEIVFQYFVDPGKLVQWMGLKAEVDAVAGGPSRIPFSRGMGGGGGVVPVPPPRPLGFSLGSRPPGATPRPRRPGPPGVARTPVG